MSIAIQMNIAAGVVVAVIRTRAVVAVVHARELMFRADHQGAVQTSEPRLILFSIVCFFVPLLFMDTVIFFKRRGITMIPVPGISVTHWDLNEKPAAGKPVAGCKDLTQSIRQSNNESSYCSCKNWTCLEMQTTGQCAAPVAE